MSEIYIFLLKIEVVHIDFYLWAKKKESRLTPTFVNLKSNTMKNTLQRYALS